MLSPHDGNRKLPKDLGWFRCRGARPPSLLEPMHVRSESRIRASGTRRSTTQSSRGFTRRLNPIARRPITLRHVGPGGSLGTTSHLHLRGHSCPTAIPRRSEGSRRHARPSPDRYGYWRPIRPPQPITWRTASSPSNRRSSLDRPMVLHVDDTRSPLEGPVTTKAKRSGPSHAGATSERGRCGARARNECCALPATQQLRPGGGPGRSQTCQ